MLQFSWRTEAAQFIGFIINNPVAILLYRFEQINEMQQTIVLHTITSVNQLMQWYNIHPMHSNTE